MREVAWGTLSNRGDRGGRWKVTVSHLWGREGCGEASDLSSLARTVARRGPAAAGCFCACVGGGLAPRGGSVGSYFDCASFETGVDVCRGVWS